jgi:hypothetical protein
LIYAARSPVDASLMATGVAGIIKHKDVKKRQERNSQQDA